MLKKLVVMCQSTDWLPHAHYVMAATSSEGLKLCFSVKGNHFIAIAYNFKLYFSISFELIKIINLFLSKFVTFLYNR